MPTYKILHWGHIAGKAFPTNYINGPHTAHGSGRVMNDYFTSLLTSSPAPSASPRPPQRKVQNELGNSCL